MAETLLVAFALAFLFPTSALRSSAFAQTLSGTPAAAPAPTAFPLSPAQDLMDRKAKAEATKAEAEAHYYQAKAAESEDWFAALKSQAASLFLALAAAATALTGYINWRLAKTSVDKKEGLDWETLRDTQYIDGLKMLGDKDSPGSRASAAALIAYLSRNTAGIPNDLVHAQLTRARLSETNPQALEGIEEALYYLSYKNFATPEQLTQFKNAGRPYPRGDA